MNTKELVFRNLVNGVEVQKVAESFNKTEAEVIQDFKAVALSIANYVMLNGVPWFPCQEIIDARANKVQCLHFLGLVDLDEVPMYSKVVGESL